jgi:hypothetical protein
MTAFFICHPRESGDPVSSLNASRQRRWIPAFAGMTR